MSRQVKCHECRMSQRVRCLECGDMYDIEDSDAGIYANFCSEWCELKRDAFWEPEGPEYSDEDEPW